MAHLDETDFNTDLLYPRIGQEDLGASTEQLTSNDALFTTSEAKTFLRVDLSDEDALIDDLVKAATVYAQRYTWRQFLDAEFKLHLDVLPDSSTTPVEIPYPPLSSIDRFDYTDEDGNSQSFSDYQTDLHRVPARVMPKPDKDWPDTDEDLLNAISIKFTAGYGSSRTDVPDAIQSAVRIILSWMFDNRQAKSVAPGVAMDIGIPVAAQRLLDPYAIHRVK